MIINIGAFFIEIINIGVAVVILVKGSKIFNLKLTQKTRSWILLWEHVIDYPFEERDVSKPRMFLK